MKSYLQANLEFVGAMVIEFRFFNQIKKNTQNFFEYRTHTVRVKKKPFRLTGDPFKKQGNERTLNGNRKEDERMENGWHLFRFTVTYPFFSPWGRAHRLLKRPASWQFT